MTTAASATRSRKLEVDIVALEMMVLRVLSAEKQRQAERSTWRAC
jgi:hypothetical protein